ncbi:MAG: hypothetical protein Q8L22_05435, partial [Reyranella sp.]|nr:hypothetical protein [Reyranella sp.]
FSLKLTGVFAIALEGMLVFLNLETLSHSVATSGWQQALKSDAMVLAPACVLIFVAGWCAYTWTHSVSAKWTRAALLALGIPCLAVAFFTLAAAIFMGPTIIPPAIEFAVKNFGVICVAATTLWSIYFAARHATFPDPLDWADKRRKV